MQLTFDLPDDTWPIAHVDGVWPCKKREGTQTKEAFYALLLVTGLRDSALCQALPLSLFSWASGTEAMHQMCPHMFWYLACL